MQELATEALETGNPNAHKPVEDLGEVFADLGHGCAAVQGVLDLLMKAVGGEADLYFATLAAIQEASLKPYFNLSDYMGRSWLREKREGMGYAARVHRIMRSDLARALHDHPWHNASLLLQGGYWEVQPGLFQAALEKYRFGKCGTHTVLQGNTCALEHEVQILDGIVRKHPAQQVPQERVLRLQELGVYWRGPGQYTRRMAESLHRLIVPEGLEAYTLFVMRPKVKEWGFLDAELGWMHNEAYLARHGAEV